MRYLVLKGDVVVNAILWDGRRRIEVDGELVKESDMPGAQIGWVKRSGGAWENPRPIPEKKAPEGAVSVTAELEALRAEVTLLKAAK